MTGIEGVSRRVRRIVLITNRMLDAALYRRQRRVPSCIRLDRIDVAAAAFRTPPGQQRRWHLEALLRRALQFDDRAIFAFAASEMDADKGGAVSAGHASPRLPRASS
jgi:hypothetical protein